MPFDFANSDQVSTTHENPTEDSLLFGMSPGANGPSMWTIGSILGAAAAAASSTSTSTVGSIAVTTTLFTSNGTYTKNANLIFAEVICVGKGGAGANGT